MASFVRLSFPALLPSSTFNRFLNPPTLFNAAKQFQRLSRPLIGAAENRCNHFSIRSVTVNASTEEEVPRSVPIHVAYELLQAGHRYLDVRTVDEFNVGHPVGATNIPYMFRAGSGMSKNPNFLEEVSSVYGKADEIIIGCQSGRRSLMAAADLSSAGFTGVVDIAGGYSAWMQNGLPTHQ